MPMNSLRLLASAAVCAALGSAGVAHAQRGPGTQVEDPQVAFDAMMTAVDHLLVEIDSIESVSWPSAKALLARHTGDLVLIGTSTRIREDPANAAALADRVAAALLTRGTRVRVEPHVRTLADGSRVWFTREHCLRTPPPDPVTTCTFPDDVAMVMTVGFPGTSANVIIAQITMITDSRIRADNPVVSLDVLLERSGTAWRVTRISRTRGASD
jgi:hypothetical protein